MKKLLFILLTVFSLSCNNEIDLNIDPENQTVPDYNLLSESQPLKYDSVANKYSAEPILYLRPFENVSDTDIVTIKFNSPQFSRYIIKGDTLYNNDKVNIKYLDFTNFLIKFKYESESKNTHSITVETTIKSVNKSTIITF